MAGQKQIFITASVPANSTLDVTPTLMKTDNAPRIIHDVGFSGATVNTGKLHAKIAGTEVTGNGIVNGVTRTAGQVISSDDYVSIEKTIESNQAFVLEVDNTSAGALTYYIYIDIESAED